MITINAYTAADENAPLQSQSYDIPSLNEHEVLIKISHCGVCRSDLHFIGNDWGDSQFPLVPGHEIVGAVIECGAAVKLLTLKQRVGVSWQQGACLECEWCQADQEEFCQDLKAVCLNCRGGFADYCVVDARFVYTLPDQLDSESIAPLMCAGATVFHALTVYQVKAGMKVAVVGIGGLGHMALQFASKMGCDVTALTDVAGNTSDVFELGASDAYSSSSESLKQLENRFDFILVTTDAPLDYHALMMALRPKGKLCFAGMPPDDIKINLFPLVIGQRSICATPCGNRQTIKAMLEFAAAQGIKPRVQLMPMQDVNAAIEKLRQGQVRYRVVLCNEKD